MNTALDDHRLRYLFEAIRLGSVRAAADHLDVNPSVVSRQIAQLERKRAELETAISALRETHGRMTGGEGRSATAA